MTGSADLVFNIALEEYNLGGAYQCARIGGGLSRVPAESWLPGGTLCRGRWPPFVRPVSVALVLMERHPGVNTRHQLGPHHPRPVYRGRSNVRVRRRLSQNLTLGFFMSASDRFYFITP